MLRFAVLPLALVAAPALASDHYRAEPITAPAQAHFVARHNVWRCGEAGCASTRSSARPAIVCATLARQIGALKSFSVEGRTFDAEALASCNRRAAR